MGDKPLAELGRVHMKRVEEALRVLVGELWVLISGVGFDVLKLTSTCISF